MADAVGLWVTVYFCVTSVNTKDCTDPKTTDVRGLDNARSNRLHQDLNYTIRYVQHVIKCTSIKLYNPVIYYQSMFIEQVANL